jgi:hypothetical protein
MTKTLAFLCTLAIVDAKVDYSIGTQEKRQFVENIELFSIAFSFTASFFVYKMCPLFTLHLTWIGIADSSLIFGSAHLVDRCKCTTARLFVL